MSATCRAGIALTAAAATVTSGAASAADLSPPPPSLPRRVQLMTTTSTALQRQRRRLDVSYNHQLQHQHQRQSLIVRGGGYLPFHVSEDDSNGSDDDNDEAEFDAYLSSLIERVDDEEEEEDGEDVEATASDEVVDEKEEEEGVDNVSDEEESESEAESVDEGASAEDVADTKADASDNESDPAIAAATPTTRKMSRPTPATNQPTTTRNIASKSNDKPSIPPNAVYRFWLTKGRIGHVIVTALFLLSEFVTCYVPALASLTTWLLKSLHIYDAEKAIRVAEARRAAAMRGHAVGLTKGGRFGGRGNKKALRARKKMADQAAVSKLRSLGEAIDSKYCHLSSSFMKRHGLGPYRLLEEEMQGAATRDGLVKDVVGEVAAMEKSTTGIKDLHGEEGSTEVDETEEKEEDWVVQALSKEQTPVSAGPTSKKDVFDREEASVPSSDDSVFRVEPSVAIETRSSGPNSVSIGLDFSIGGQKRQSSTRDAMLKAAAASKSSHIQGKRRKAVGQRSSDRDGGGGVLGRLRAVGASSMISSRVLGAYPGDAVPIDEASSANGLFSLASRYGYGDWSDDDDDYDDSEDGQIDIESPKKKRRSKQRRRRSQSSSSQSKARSSAELQHKESRRRRSSRSSLGAEESRRRPSPSDSAFTSSSWNSWQKEEPFPSNDRSTIATSMFRQNTGASLSAPPASATFPSIAPSPDLTEISAKRLKKSGLAERRQIAVSNTIVRAPMMRTHEKDNERKSI